MKRLRAISVILAATGLWMIARSWMSYRYSVQSLRQGLPVAGIVITTLLAIMMLVPVLKLIVALGLWNGWRWSWFAAIPVLSVDVIIWMIAAIRLHTISSGAGAILREAISERGVAPTESVSMLPGYVVALTSIVCIFLLMRKPVRDSIYGMFI